MGIKSVIYHNDEYFENAKKHNNNYIQLSDNEYIFNKLELDESVFYMLKNVVLII